MAAWPVTLPQQLEQDGYQEKLPAGSIRTDMDAGPAKVRKRFTAVPRPFVGQMFLTPTQAATLDTFWQTDTAFGSIPFDWVHPRTGAAASCRLTEPPAIAAEQGKYKATVYFEVLP